MNEHVLNNSKLDVLVSRIAPETNGRKIGKKASMDKQTGACAYHLGSCKDCSGMGYVLIAEGVFSKAKACNCIMHCKTCQGTMNRLVGGALTPCRSPSLAKIIQNINNARIPARFINADFSSYSNINPQNAQVIQQLVQWVNGFGPGTERGVLLTGPVGVGKTFLLCAMAKALAARGFSVRFTDFFQLLSELRSAYADGRGDPEILDPLRKVDVLFVDELGKGRATDWEMSIADTLVSDRYNAGKIIVASTNYLLKESSAEYLVNRDLERDLIDGSQEFSPLSFGLLESRIGKRIFSRLLEMTSFVEMTGLDFRKVIAQRRSNSL